MHHTIDSASPRAQCFATLTFSITLFLSALLLFILEPMVAKRLLPLWGGSPAIWITCMVFFQTMLLLGYGYAHLSGRHLKPRQQVIAHLLLVAVSLVSLPLLFYPHWHAIEGVPPFLGLLARLLSGIGLPFLALSANAPLLQNWLARSGKSKNPYALYSASNLGSLLGLMAYPLLLEPHLGLSAQGLVWGLGLVLLAGMIALCAAFARPLSVPQMESPEKEHGTPPSLSLKARWVVLAFVPSSLMLGVTSYFTMDIASLPLLWVLPLALYLLSFVIAFSHLPRAFFRTVSISMPFAVIGLVLVASLGLSLSIAMALVCHLTVFFIVALALHSELAGLKPHSHYLTSFYLWMSAGGVLGGLFNSLVAPRIFSTSMEYPIALAAACLALCVGVAAAKVKYSKRFLAGELALALLLSAITLWLVTDLFAERLPTPLLMSRLAVMLSLRGWVLKYIMAALIAAGLAAFQRRLALTIVISVFIWEGFAPTPGGDGEFVVSRERNFFGAATLSASPLFGYLKLTNGTTIHGIEYAPGTPLSGVPITYYHPSGPVGDVFATMGEKLAKREIGVIGLGTGSIAAYGEPGQRITFFEIDDKIARIARERFSFLKTTRAEPRILLGDARLKLETIPDETFGVLFADAFSSDAIPVHLLTREAVALYLRKVKKDGVVMIHLTNRHLNLIPVVARLARELGLSAMLRVDPGDMGNRYSSIWAVLAHAPQDFAPLAAKTEWKPLEVAETAPLWTDDYTPLYDVIDFRSEQHTE